MSGEFGANVSLPALAGIGLNLKASTASKEYQKEAPILSMINEDCSIVNDMSLEELKQIAGQENDLSETLCDSNLILGSLNSYIIALESLSTATVASTKKQFEDKKHECEKLLLPKKRIGSNGRAGVLKAAIVTVAALRHILEKSKRLNNEEELRFKKIYDNLLKLAKLNEFSKNKSGIRTKIGYGAKATTQTAVKATVNKLQASFNLDIPYMGSVIANVTRQSKKTRVFY